MPPARTSADRIRSWLVLVVIFLLALPLALYLVDPAFWLVLYSQILLNLQILALIAIALTLYYNLKERIK